MSEIKANVYHSGVGWKGVKEGDLLKVTKVEASERGVFLTLDDEVADKGQGSPPYNPDDPPF